MTILAIVRPTGLLAGELRDALDAHSDLFQEVRLLSDDESEVGTLTDVAGAAAMVGAFDAEGMDRVDVAFVFGRPEHYAMALAAASPALSAIVVSTDIVEHTEDAVPLVAGINLDQARRAGVNLSPHPGVVGLAHLLHPLRDFGIESVAATLLEPVSSYGKAGLDAMFEQTRDLLNFTTRESSGPLPGQLAFNVVDAGDDPGPLERQLRTVLAADSVPGTTPLSLHVVRAGVFHSLGISLHLRLADDPGESAVRDAYRDDPFVDLSEEPMLGAIDVASRHEVVVGRTDALGQGSYRIWAVLDNITAGAAANAVAILEALAGRPVA